MLPSDEIQKYSKTVCEQIRLKSARSLVYSEIESHLCDQRDAYLSEGEEEGAATERAIAQMGDAVMIGLELDKTHRPRPQWILIALTFTLVLIGAAANYFMAGTPYSLYGVRLVPYLIAAAVFIVCYFADFTLLGTYALPCYGIYLAVMLMGLMGGDLVNGSHVWIFSPFSVTLAYLALAAPLAFALLVYAMRTRGRGGIVLCVAGYIPVAVLLAYCPTVSGFVLYTVSAILILGLAISKGWFYSGQKTGVSPVSILLLAGGCMFLMFTMGNEDVWGRVASAVRLAPIENGDESSLVVQEMLQGAVFMGKGSLSESCPVIRDFYYTDYILTILIHQFGWIVCIFLAAVFALFTGTALHAVRRQKSVLGTLISCSVLLSFLLQSAFYVTNNLGFRFYAPLSLPFISYGNTALILNAAMTGFMLSVFRTGDSYRNSVEDNPPILNI